LARTPISVVAPQTAEWPLCHQFFNRATNAAMEVLIDEKLAENATRMGKIFRDEMKAFNSPLIAEVRGKGLLNAIQMKTPDGKKAWDLCLLMKENGILAKPTHEHTIRFTPPLIITEPQMREAIGLIQRSMKEFI
jgi:ornithine--oxo-acid transaminase